jgi:hypothetical protein
MLLNIFNTKPSYYKEYESFCFQNCLRQVLEYYGVENAALYINSALSFVLESNNSYPNGFKIKYNEHSCSTLPKYGDKVRRLYYDDDKNGEDVWIINKQKIDEGIPIITGVDVFYLPYQTYYNNSHGIHTLILCGYSELEDFINIIDWYEPWFFKGVINKKEFISARSSTNPQGEGVYSGTPIRNNWAEIDTYGWESNPVELIYQTIDLSIEQYYNNAFVDDQNVMQGINAIKRLYEIVLENKVKIPEERSKFLKDLHNTLFVALKRQKLFKLYLELSTQWVKINSIISAINQMKEVIEKWDLILMYILKASISKLDGTYDKVLNNMIENISFEEKIYDILVNVKNELGK